MAVTNTIIDQVKQDILDRFDIFTHIAVGSDGTSDSPSDTALGNEVLRKTFTEYNKDTLNFTYLWSIQLALTEANGYTLQEVGIFDDASGGNLGIRKTFTAIEKTSDKEVWIDLQLNIEVENT